MPYRIIHKLVDEGLISGEAPPAFCGNFQRHVKLFFPPDAKGGGVFVKFSTDDSLINEYHVIEACKDSWGEFLVAPLGCWQEEGVSAIAYPLVENSPVSGLCLRSERIQNLIADLLQRFFQQPRVRFVNQDDMQSGEAGLQALSETDAPLAWRRYMDTSWAYLRQHYEGVPQHGDMTINNLACGPQENIFLFDWEDYGRITLPFFDMATLLFSIAIRENRVESLGRSPRNIFRLDGARAVRSAMQAEGLEEEKFLQLFPCFMIVFLGVKAHLAYGEQVIDQLKQFLFQVSRTPEWRQVAGVDS